MSATKIEFAVQMTCNSCVEAVQKSLQGVHGIKNVDIDLTNESVVIESSLPTLELQTILESTGKKVAVKGYAGSIAAVSIIEAGNKNIQGVVRFVQAPQVCIIDGTIDGLKSGQYRINVHECGDLSDGCDSVGDIFNPTKIITGRVYGDIGTVSSHSGRAAFRLEDKFIKLSDIIGRSFVVAEENGSKKIACGIIARSAGLFQNPKMICACDGVTLWDEVSKSKQSSL